MSGVALLLVRLILAAAFLAAGAAKLRHQARFRETLAEFGVASRFIGSVALVLPAVEIAAAALLLTNPATQSGAVVSASLLVVFIAAIAYQLARGRSPHCTCFGHVGSRPIDGATLARNLALLSGAVLLALTDPARANDAMNRSLLALASSPLAWTLNVVLFAVAAGESVVLIRVMRRHGDTLHRIDALEKSSVPQFGLPIGTVAPACGLVANKPAIVIFSHPKCTACTSLEPDIARWQRDFASFQIVVISERDDVAAAYRVPGTPAAVAITGDGVIASALALGSDGVRKLALDATSSAGALISVPA